MKIIQLLLFVPAGVMFTFCSSPTDDTIKDNDAVNMVDVDSSFLFESERFEFVLPQPFALISSFEKVGLNYQVDRTNPTENVKNYTSKGDQLINFGVYSVDLIYCIINEQPQQSILYFNAMKNLAEQFGMGSVFTEDELALEIEANIANREVLEGLLVDVHERSQEYLEDNQLKYLSAIQFSGAWVEGMYLASFNFDTSNPSMNAELINQMSLLKNTILGLQMYDERDEDTEKILSLLKSFETTYSNFDSVKNSTTDEKPVLTTEEVTIIQEKITEIRNLIIS